MNRQLMVLPRLLAQPVVVQRRARDEADRYSGYMVSLLPAQNDLWKSLYIICGFVVDILGKTQHRMIKAQQYKDCQSQILTWAHVYHHVFNTKG